MALEKEIEDIVAEEIPKEEKIQVSDEKGNKQDIDFLSQDYSKTFTSAKQNEVASDDSQENESGTKSEEKKKEETQSKSQDMSPFDYEDISEFSIELIDIAMSNGLKFASGSDKTTPFELPSNKKYKLSKMLSKILAKHQVALSLESIFVVTLLMCYYEPAKKAFEIRKNKSEGYKDGIKKTDNPPMSIIRETETETKEDDSNKAPRSAGRPAKKK